MAETGIRIDSGEQNVVRQLFDQTVVGNFLGDEGTETGIITAIEISHRRLGILL
jgi:hypothetical protein